MIRIAINGFGRIGRLAFRQIYDLEDVEVVAINDLSDTKVLSHLLKYDTAQKGFLTDRISYTEDDIVVDDKKRKKTINMRYRKSLNLYLKKLIKMI